MHALHYSNTGVLKSNLVRIDRELKKKKLRIDTNKWNLVFLYSLIILLTRKKKKKEKGSHAKLAAKLARDCSGFYPMCVQEERTVAHSWASLVQLWGQRLAPRSISAFRLLYSRLFCALSSLCLSPIFVLVPQVTSTFRDNMDTTNKSLHVKLPPNGMSDGIYTRVAESGM